MRGKFAVRLSAPVSSHILSATFTTQSAGNESNNMIAFVMVCQNTHPLLRAVFKSNQFSASCIRHHVEFPFQVRIEELALIRSWDQLLRRSKFLFPHELRFHQQRDQLQILTCNQTLIQRDKPLFCSFGVFVFLVNELELISYSGFVFCLSIRSCAIHSPDVSSSLRRSIQQFHFRIL